MIKAANQILSFLLELAMLTALGYCGFRLGHSTFTDLLLGIGMPALVIGWWGYFMAPTAKRRLPTPWLQITTLLLFEMAAVGLYLVGQKEWSIPFGVVALVNVVLAAVLKDKRPILDNEK